MQSAIHARLRFYGAILKRLRRMVCTYLFWNYLCCTLCIQTTTLACSLIHPRKLQVINIVNLLTFFGVCPIQPLQLKWRLHGNTALSETNSNAVNSRILEEIQLITQYFRSDYGIKQNSGCLPNTTRHSIYQPSHPHIPAPALYYHSNYSLCPRLPLWPR